MTISIVTISKNEENEIKDFINSFIWADEIIIIDDFSVDETKKIVKKLNKKNVRFIQKKQKSNGFGDQRNYGILQASCDYIVNVDCDMRCSKDFVDELKSVLTKKPDIIYFSILNHFLNQPLHYGPWSKWHKPWIFRNGIAKFSKGVHEKITYNIESNNFKVFHLNERIIHLGDRDYVERLSKNINYSLDDYNKYLKNKKISFAYLITTPFFRFFLDFFWHKNFLNGKIGLLLSLYTSLSLFNRLLIAWEKQKKYLDNRK